MSLERIIDVAEEAVRLSIQNGLLVISCRDKPDYTVPLTEVAALVVSSDAASYTHAVLAEIARAGATFVACDRRHLPVGVLLPLVGHTTQTERFRQQLNAPMPLRKRLWQQVVSAKIREQGRLLRGLQGSDRGLLAMSKRVRSGDAGNLEGQAAKRYWPALFEGGTFRRDPEAEDQNVFLNYGYAVLRATVARAIVASGLHPTIGIHHRNRYDAFCLADDLMEPLRPLVDRAVVDLVGKRPGSFDLDSVARRILLSTFLGRFSLDGESRTLFDVLARTASSLAAVFASERDDLVLPEIIDGTEAT